MAYESAMAYLDAAPGVTRDYKPEWEATRWMVDGKMFAMRGGDKTGRPVLTLKLPPEECELMRTAFPGVVIPGYYMNKTHWVSLYLDADLPEAEACCMAESAYGHFLRTLTRNRQAEIAAMSL